MYFLLFVLKTTYSDKVNGIGTVLISGNDFVRMLTLRTTFPVFFFTEERFNKVRIEGPGIDAIKF